MKDKAQVDKEEIRSIVPPNNVEAEKALLGALMFDPSGIAKIVKDLSPESFYVQIHAEIFRAIQSLYDKGKPYDLGFVESELKEQGKLDFVGGRSHLASLVSSVISSVNLDFLSELIQEKYLRRKYAEASLSCQQLAYNESIPLSEVEEKIQHEIYSVGKQDESGTGSLHISNVMNKVVGDVFDRSQAGGISLGLTCGFYELDAMTQGFHRSDLVIIAGRPAMGKTSFALQAGYQVARFHNAPVVIFSLEMSKEQLAYRRLSSEVRLPSDRLRAGRLSEEEQEVVGKVVPRIVDSLVFLDDNPVVDIGYIKGECRKIEMKTKQPIGLIIVDYLQLMGQSADTNRVQELSRLTRGFKQMARELNTTVILLSQLSRGVESRTNKRPMMSDLRESGSIEQDGDIVMMLYRDEYYDPNSSDRGIAEVIICKHRNGPTGTVKLLFESAFTRFSNMPNSY